jgi:pimeloyl-ACP methyl ester carboxylesterase
MLATPLETATLPPGIRSRFVRGVNGLDIHILEAGYAPAGRPLVLLLHGFPEIAYSWRKVMPALAEAGFHAVAPDQRGYGRTTGWSPDFDTDLRPWRTLNAVRDALGLVAALGHRSIHAVVGNDFGAGIAAWCALVRPDVFRSLALMTPFGGPPDLPFATDGKEPAPPATPTIHEALAALPNGSDWLKKKAPRPGRAPPTDTGCRPLPIRPCGNGTSPSRRACPVGFWPPSSGSMPISI